MTSALEGVVEKWTRVLISCVIMYVTRGGEGVKKFENFMDVIDGSPLTSPALRRAPWRQCGLACRAKLPCRDVGLLLQKLHCLAKGIQCISLLEPGRDILKTNAEVSYKVGKDLRSDSHGDRERV